MNARFKLGIILVLSLFIYGVVFRILSPMRTEFLKFNYVAYMMPSEASGPLSLEFKELVSDFLFLKMITHFGEKIENKEKLDKRHADFLYRSTDVITDLDPWFWDAYLVADMNLTWGFGQIEKANHLLEKAHKYRTDDYNVPFYLGFNYYYFLKDSSNGAKYLREAANLPGSPSTLPYLASRISLYADDHEAAIEFLQNILKKIKNQKMIDQLKMRLQALIHMDMLEKKVAEYIETYNNNPKSLDDLVTSGLIQEIPKDPYGGRYYLILPGGRVYTTSKLRIKK